MGQQSVVNNLEESQAARRSFFSPLTIRRLEQFRKNKLAVGSLGVLASIILLSVLAPFIANNRPIVMSYQGQIWVPVLQNPTWQDLGLKQMVFVVDYKGLDWDAEGNWAIWPLVKFNPYESNKELARYPAPPSWENPFGTDDRGRDVFARLLYGFQYSFSYAIGVWLITYFIGVIAGLLMGYFGGGIDFFFQRVVEVLSSVPQFFLLIILISIFQPSVPLLILITSVFGWISISYYLRAEALKLRSQEFVDAARAIGKGTWGILIKHILPNGLTPIITFSPFAIATAITGLTALDYLGFGLPPPTPSWGELLNQAKKYVTTGWWLAAFPSLALFLTLSLLNFVGEGLRNAFDPRD